MKIIQTFEYGGDKLFIDGIITDKEAEENLLKQYGKFHGFKWIAKDGEENSPPLYNTMGSQEKFTEWAIRKMKEERDNYPQDWSKNIMKLN